MQDNFFTPFVQANNATAIRLMKSTLMDQRDSVMYNNPQDYDLYKLGEFDTITGEFISKVEKIINGKALMTTEVNNG